MNSQVALYVSLSNASDPNYWLEQGWKGAIATILLLAVFFSIYKGAIGIVSIGPSEAGVRELFGVRLWRIGPGPHLNIEGFWKARKTSLAVIEVSLSGEYPLTNYTKQYTCEVWLRVQDTKEALFAHMYRAQDLNRDNMENSEAVKQATSLLKRNLRVILEEGYSASQAEQQLEYVTHKQLLEEYGYEIVEVLLTEITDRPMSELARAVAENGDVTNAVAGAIGAGQTLPRLSAVDGGAVGAS